MIQLALSAPSIQGLMQTFGGKQGPPVTASKGAPRRASKGTPKRAGGYTFQSGSWKDPCFSCQASAGDLSGQHCLPSRKTKKCYGKQTKHGNKWCHRGLRGSVSHQWASWGFLPKCQRPAGWRSETFTGRGSKKIQR